MTLPRRGEVWWAEWQGKRRPVLIVTRDAAIPVLRTVLVAPITSRVRGIPTEMALDRADGMPRECAAAFDNLTVADRDLLSERIATLSEVRMLDACRALRFAADC